MRSSRNKTPEGKLVTTRHWHGSTVTNDADLIQSKGIKSPELGAMYASAYHPFSKLRMWFRTKERLVAWRKVTPDYKDYIITINN